MIIGISGLAGSGKDTVADFIVKHKFVKVALADPMKRIAKEMYDFSNETLWGPSQLRNIPDKRYPRKAHTWPFNGLDCECCAMNYYDILETIKKNVDVDISCYLTARYVLRLMGTELGRNCYEDTWVDKTVRVLKDVLNSNDLIYSPFDGLIHGEDDKKQGGVVSDVRFISEMGGLKKHNVCLIRVKRKGYEKPTSTHPSETEQLKIPDSDFDFVLENNTSLEELEQKTIDLLGKLSA